jgi:hypothetical protein
MDAEHLIEIMDPVLGLMSDVVDRYGGRVNKFRRSSRRSRRRRRPR